MRWKKNSFFKIGLCFLGIFFLSGCGSRQWAKVESPKVYVGVSCYDNSDVFVKELTSQLQEDLKTIGEKKHISTLMTLRDAANSSRKQNQQVQELIDAGCNVLCINLVERTDPSKIIELAKKNDIPVIFFNREPVPEDLKQWEKLYYVGADAKESGRMQGELAAEAIFKNTQIDRNQDGIIQYVVLEGEPGHQDAIIRTEEAINTLKSKGIKLEKLGHGIANWNRAQAENRMQQLISKYQNKIELVLSNNDDMALGAIDAYTKLNQTAASTPIFFGVDGTTAGLQAIKEGTLAGTVYNNHKAQAETMARLATALATDESLKTFSFKNQRALYLPYDKITIENVKNYEKK